jgi:pimeloyl-ACP methyl ester carboxylesterase
MEGKRMRMAGWIHRVVAMLVVAASPAFAETPVGVDLTAPGPNAPLHGTLLNAGKGTPVVLIIPGSGPTDRDGNNPYGVRAKTYRLMAEALAAKGISSVRIDKRGMFASKPAIADGNAVRIADYADDVRSWVKAAQTATGARCVWLLGHSEGGLVVLAAGDASNICGYILISASGRPFGALIHDQIHANPANAIIFDQADAALAKLEAGKKVDVTGMSPALMPLFNPAVQDYLIDLIHYQPVDLAAQTRLPMLIVQGQSDLQINESDARALAKARPDATLVLLPGVNHVLKNIGAGDVRANVASYANPDLPIDPGVVAAVADFVSAGRH